MRTISNSSTFRKNIVSSLSKLIQDDAIAVNLEKGVFNYSLKKAEDRDVIKKWEGVILTINNVKSTPLLFNCS